jgi:hypothetical protein
VSLEREAWLSVRLAAEVAPRLNELKSDPAWRDRGSNHATGFSTNGASTATIDMNHNRFVPATNTIFFSAAQTNPIIQGNRFGGKTTTYAGSATTYIVNNVP